MRVCPYRSLLSLITAFAVVFVTSASLAQTARKRTPSKPPAKKPPVTKPALQKIVLDAVLKEAIRAAPDASRWPDHDYARLLDIGEVTVQSDGTVVATYRETYKLFNERARGLAEVNLPFNSSYQGVKVISARTIKKDGTIVPVKPQDIRLMTAFSDFPLYDDAIYTSFSMPAVEDDCIIDYTYEMVTLPLLMPGQFWTYWGFSGPEPVRISRYTLHAPADKPLRYKVYNDEGLQPTVTTSKNGKTKTYVWERKDIPPIKLEPAMPPVQDVRIWMEVSSLGSWEDVGKWFWGLAKPQAKPTEKIKTTVNKLIAGKTTDMEKAKALYDFVANRVRYVGLEFGISAFKPHAASEVHDKLYGDCKDKTTLLVTMLGLAGIQAHPVLIRANDPRPIETGLPNLAAFNHCIAIAQIEGKEFWLDSTAETCPVGDIPDGNRGAQALVVKEEGAQFRIVPRYNPDENGVEWTMAIALQPDGSAKTVLELAMRGSAAQAMRATARALPPDKRKEMMRGMAEQIAAGSAVNDFHLPDGMDKEGAFVMKMDFDSPDYAKTVGSLLLVPIKSNIGPAEQRNPFASAEPRVWPIVETENSLTHIRATLTLPEGYEIEEVPADQKFTCGVQDYERKIVKSEDGKTITVTITIAERAGTLPPTDNEKIKVYYDSVLKTMNDQVVLKRKK